MWGGHQEQQPGQSEVQVCVVREAQRVMVMMRRSVWEQEPVQREQMAVCQQLGKMARVRQRV
jgi:hypothetical protein